MEEAPTQKLEPTPQLEQVEANISRGRNTFTVTTTTKLQKENRREETEQSKTK